MCFCFTHKTVYEFRMGDIGSDVCSPDLSTAACTRRWRSNLQSCLNRWDSSLLRNLCYRKIMKAWSRSLRSRASRSRWVNGFIPAGTSSHSLRAEQSTRSEEHTSELQSLMRISYAVFCLKKKKYIIMRKIHSY